MLTIFYRRFYILMFLVWLVAIAGLFVLSVWGNFGSFMSDFDRIVRVWDSDCREAVLGNGTNGTFAGGPGAVNGTVNASEQAQNNGSSVRRFVVREIHEVEKDVEELFGDAPPAAPAPVNATKPEPQEPAKPKVEPINQADEGKLTKLTFIKRYDSLLTRLVTSRKAERITYFWLENPVKLVVDVRGHWQNGVKNVYRFDDSFVSKVVLGVHPDRLRMVFLLGGNSTPEFTNATNATGFTKWGRPAIAHTPEGVDIILDRPGQ